MKTLTNQFFIKRKTQLKQQLTVKAVIGIASFIFLQTACSPISQESIQAKTSDKLAENSSPSALNTVQKIYVDEAMLNELKPNKVDCPNDDVLNDKPKICILICHVPPGNPLKAKDKIIPLQALSAHLNHGQESLEQRDYLGSCAKAETPTTADPNTDGTSSTDSTNNTDSTEQPIVDNSANSSEPNTTTPGSTSDSTTPADTTSDPTTSAGTAGDSATSTDSTSEPSTTTDTTTVSEQPTPASTNDTIPLWCQAYIEIDSNCDGFDDLTGDPLL